jgi:hypothetical protein
MRVIAINHEGVGGPESTAPAQPAVMPRVRRTNQHERASIYERLVTHGAKVVSIARGEGMPIQQVVELALEQAAIERQEACKRAFTAGRIAGMSFPLKRAA